jgi:hypothetical protein
MIGPHYFVAKSSLMFSHLHSYPSQIELSIFVFGLWAAYT